MPRLTAENCLAELSKRFEEQAELAEESAVLAVFRGVADGFGGIDALGRMIYEDFNRLRSEEPAKRKEKLVLEYHKLIKSWADAYDTAMRASKGVENLSEDDLRGILSELAVSLLREDDSFLRAVLFETGRLEQRHLDGLIASLQAVRNGDQAAWSKLDVIETTVYDEGDGEIGDADFADDADADADEITEGEGAALSIEDSHKELLEI